MSIQYTNESLKLAIDDYYDQDMPSNIDINTWDTSEVTDMSELFINMNNFNKPLDRWNTSKVTNMADMFYECTQFNQPLNSWDVSLVTNMEGVFYGCVEFNQPLDRWDTQNVEDMNSMFSTCTKFNQSLDSWKTSNVNNMYSMFSKCDVFNQPLNSWKTSKVHNMSFLFYDCTEFNQPLDKWNTQNVSDMKAMFSGCVEFNQPLNSFNVSSVHTMAQLFFDCESFNQPLDRWNTQNVTNMNSMFANCTNFNQSLSTWDTHNVTDMTNIFNGYDSIENWEHRIPPQGVAYEIHNAFNQHYALNKNKYFEIIGKPPDSIYTSINIINYIKPKLIELIKKVYPTTEVVSKTDEMNQILNTINIARELSEKRDTKLLLGKTVDFLVTQSNEFVHFYLEALKYDCLNAYSTGTNRSSCVKGMIERFYLTMGDTAYALCPEPDTCANPTYNELVSLFNKRVDKNELTQEWNQTFLEDPIKKAELLKLNKEERKDHYRQFMIQKYTEAGQIPNEQASQMVLRDIIEPEVIALDYVFDGLQFGGKKSRKSRKSRKLVRKKSTRKKSTRKKSNKKLHCIRRKSKKR